MEENKNNIVAQNSAVEQLLNAKAKEAQDVNTVVDVAATAAALQDAETVNKLVGEKGEELKNKAEALRIQAETGKIEKETEKIKQEKEKQLAELDKEIEKRKAEVEQLKADSNKAEIFFKSNEEILSCVGITSAKTLKVMYAFMPLAIIVFLFIRFIALPLTVGGKLAEIVIEIIGGICKAINNSALKIIVSIFVVILLLGGGFCAYFFGGKLFI